MSLVVLRVPTVYSLKQLQLEAGEQQATDNSPAAMLAAPLCPVSDLPGKALPLYRFHQRDSFACKKVRSFGDLDTIVPDMEDPM
jgi:hypothetical protein